MPLWEHYHTPETVAGALTCLGRYAGDARVIAGGTDLLIDLQHIEQGEHPLAALVDVTAVEEMTQVRAEDDWLYVGAAVVIRRRTA